MLYTGVVTKKKKLFQKAFTIDNKTIYITDTHRAKTRFLKSGIKNVVFNCDLSQDEVLAYKLIPLYGYDEKFLMSYIRTMFEDLLGLMKISPPLLTVAVSAKEAVPIALSFAKTVILTGTGEDYISDGVNVVYVKRLRRMPDAAIVLNHGHLPPLPGVPRVDISENATCAPLCIPWQNLSFKCSLFPYEIGAKSLIHLLNTGEEFSFELTSARKKLPTLFTFS